MNLSSTIKSIQDIMRKDDGVDGDAQRLGQLTWMLFLKVFDQREEEWEDDNAAYQSPLPERFRPLPARRNLVVSRDAAFQAPGAEVVDSLDAALEQVRDDGGRVFVIGGEQLFALALPRAQVLVLTEIDRDFDGRTRFPDWPRADFIEAWRTRHDSGLGFGYERAEYRRRA